MRSLILLLLSLVLPVSSFAAHAAPVKDDLSLIELPVKQPSDAPMVIFLSGDGGWAALDKGLSAQFQLHGMPVVGWSSLTYYWKKKTPEQVTADLERILNDYKARWQRPRWLLVGFSFGAEIVPFVINRLPEHYRQELVEHSDFRKFDGMLRMVIDGNDAQAEELQRFLDAQHRAGRLAYGLFKSGAALITCIVQSYNGKHLHFVDGSDGGYAIAASHLKQQLAALQKIH